MNGSLGYPLSDQFCGLRAGGCGEVFSGGAIYRSPATDTHVVVGPMWTEYAATGWENGLGYPIADQFCGLVNGGCGQHFQNGSIYWSPTTGAHAVVTSSRDAWAAHGWELGFGYPTSDQFCGLRGGGCGQLFQFGSTYWSPVTRAAGVTGAIRDEYAATGWENVLGYPTTDHFCGLRDGGCGQHFQNGSIYWSPATGAHKVDGAIRDKWAALGWENGLGYPLTDEFCGLMNAGCGQHFQYGSIYWSPATGAHKVDGAIRDGWAASGWEHFGYPTSDEFCGLRGGGCGQHFGFSSIYWSPATGAHGTSGGIRDQWARRGWENGRLGYPTGDVTLSRGIYSQSFQGGRLTA
jgi:uncharacterized protein with LGFP repeats